MTRRRRAPRRGSRLRLRPPPLLLVGVVAAALVLGAAAVLIFAGRGSPGQDQHQADPAPTFLPHHPQTYLGVFATGAPQSYAGITAFSDATGVRPKVVVYYSGWGEPFQATFAAVARRNNAVPLVQIDPTGASVSAIAAGRYDAYLRSYAVQVRKFGTQVILSFGHEMNGPWYSWGYRHTAPAVFVAAWRHIVTVFRQHGASNVTWLWTVNVFHGTSGIPPPGRWWPGNSYVNWVGIDGYYHKASWTFAPLFGPTIKAIRALTLDPILISETGAPTAAAQPAKIADLFAGVRAYGLLGFVWFDADRKRDWQITSSAAIAAYRAGAQQYGDLAS